MQYIDSPRVIQQLSSNPTYATLKPSECFSWLLIEYPLRVRSSNSMRTKFLLWISLFAFPLFAQKNTWFTAEGGLATNQFHFADNTSKRAAGYSGSYL